MAISFNSVPNNLRIPFVTAEFDSSQASQGNADLNYAGLIIGQKMSSGTGVANSLVRVTNDTQLIGIGGRGSMIHRQAIAWFASNESTELWVGILDDDPSGVKALAALVFSGTATASGVMALYLGGNRVTAGVTSGDAASTVATTVAAAINANEDLPVTATVSAGTVTVTAKNAGTHGNDFDIRANFQDGDSTPAGVTLAISEMSSGAGNPSLSNLIASMGDEWYNIITQPYTDATNISAIEAEMARRFDPLRQIDGVAITSASGTFSALTTLGNSRNSSGSSIIAQPAAKPLTPPCEHAAEVAAVVALYGQIDPARPLHTLPLVHTVAPKDTFTNEERNMLLYDGIGTTKVGAGDVVQLEGIITTYQKNAAGADDDSYLYVSTMLTLMLIRYTWRVRMQTKYPRHKLADDGTQFGPGQAVMTPSLGRAEAYGWFRDHEEQGHVENFDQFKAQLVVERNSNNKNRLDFYLPPDLINQLIVTASQIAHRG